MHKTRVSKYHKSNPRHVLMHMVEEIRRKKHYGNFRCWELMVDHLARWLVLNKQTGLASSPPLQGFKGLNLEKDEMYKHLESLDLFRHYFTAAKAKPWDYIGEVYMTDLELCQAGQNMTPRLLWRRTKVIRITLFSLLSLQIPFQTRNICGFHSCQEPI